MRGRVGMAPVSYEAPVNPEVLRWARESLAIDTEWAARVASVTPQRYEKWEFGEELPTISKLRKLANLYKRPLAVFFMPRVPKDPPTPTDFRFARPIENPELSTESRLVMRKALWDQAVAKDMMDDLGDSYVAIGKKAISMDDPIQQVVTKVRKLDIQKQMSWADNREALREWRHYLEDLGIFVFQYSMPIDEIRGFSLLRDGYPPVIVINSKDTVNGRIFTLFHEYGHYLLNKGGICNPDEIEFRDKKTNRVEKYCNKFSGNFLIPTKHLKGLISRADTSDIFQLIYSLSRSFKVSNFVVLRRLYDHKMMNYERYQGVYRKLVKQITRTTTTGGDYYKNRFAQKGKKFISLVVHAESSNAITTNRALELIGIKLKHYDKIVNMLYA
jgi:Zn-dependent peptidase ImmA (M78 family)